jgi:endonuclease G
MRNILIVFAFFLLSACTKNSNIIDTTKPVDQPVKLPPVIIPVTTIDSMLVLGNPSNATNNLFDYANFFLNEGYYYVSYNSDLSRANWVSWHNEASSFGTTPRQDNFRPNNELPSGWYLVDNSSYTGSGFDRGHMCPSMDRTSSIDANSSTFLMTNIIPQAPNCNQGRWAQLESYCKTLVDAGNELYIYCGVYGEGGTGDLGFASSIDNGRISVPAYLWKMIVVLPNGNNDLARINNSTRIITVMMPNDNTINQDWKSFRTSIDFIESQTNYNLLSKVPPNIQTVVEAITDNL